MSIQIHLISNDGAKSIDSSRQKTNRSNLEEAKIIWSTISDIESESALEDFISTRNSAEERKKYKDFLETIKSRLRKNCDFYNVDPENLTFSDIKKMASLYLSSDPWIQINFCKDSTRQSVDEKVQRELLNKFVEDASFTKEKKGMYVYDGRLIKGKKQMEKALGSKNLEGRKDIDSHGKKGNKNIYIFQKYAKVTGGHQDNVKAEVFNFVQDSVNYIKQNSNEIYFVAQVDGQYIENLVPEISSEIDLDSKKRVFIGKSASVINWINELE